jgi:flagellar biosynthetic protein FliQ
VTAPATVAAAREMLLLTLWLVSPFLLTAILAGLAVGILQAATRMNDLTLSFIPRFFAILLVAYLASAWASARMSDYLVRSMAAAAAIAE